MFANLLNKVQKDVHKDIQQATNRRETRATEQVRQEEVKKGASSEEQTLTEEAVKRYIEKHVERNMRVTLDMAKRFFKNYKGTTNLRKWFLKHNDASRELEEILEEGPSRANKIKLAEQLYNPINTITKPNAVHQADLLFLPHDEDDLNEIDQNRHIDIQQYIEGSGLSFEDKEHLAPHRRVHTGLSGGAAKTRPQKRRAIPERDMTEVVVEPELKVPYKYCLTVVDVASRFKGAVPLKTKTAQSVYEGLWKIYKDSPMGWPSILQTDHGSEFVGLKKILRQSKTKIATAVQLEIPFYHLGFVENFNQKLTQKIFRAQREQELRTGATVRSWTAILPSILDDFNKIPQKAIGNLTPNEAMARPEVPQKPDGPPNDSNKLFEDWEKKYADKKHPLGTIVRHYIPKDQYQQTDGDRRIVKDSGNRRTGDPVWSIRKFKVVRTYKPKDMLCDDEGENCKKNRKALWMHDIWPVDRPLPENTGEWRPKGGPSKNHKEHFGFSRSFTYFQLKPVGSGDGTKKKKKKEEVADENIKQTKSAHMKEVLDDPPEEWKEGKPDIVQSPAESSSSPAAAVNNVSSVAGPEHKKPLSTASTKQTQNKPKETVKDKKRKKSSNESIPKKRVKKAKKKKAKK